MPHALKIMVVDDDAGGRRQFQDQLAQMGHASLLLAENGRDAVETCRREQPDLILMNVLMPVMDGYEAARLIKEQHPEHWIPVIFIAADGSDEQLIRCLEVGDDFMTTPVHFALLKAKLNTMARGIRLHAQIRQKSRELEQYYADAEEEKRFTAHLMKQMLEGPGLADAALHGGSFPAAHHSGDLFIGARAPGGELFVMLADGTGHGLAAAINVMPLPPIFYTMVEKGFGLASLARELNAKAYDWLPRDRFIAATLVKVSERERVIKVWNGGNPKALLIDADGRLRYFWRSRHLPLGILAEQEFDGQWEAFPIDRPGQLVLISDGLIEAENAAGEAYGWERLLTMLAGTPPPRRYQAILADLTAHVGDGAAHDDVSLVMIDIGMAQDPALLSTPEHEPQEPGVGDDSPLRFELSLGPSELRYFDIAPQILALLDQVTGIKAHRTPLFLILSELLVNAIDHGLLQLDSRIKQQADGFDHYLALRAQRMAALRKGVVSVAVERVHDHGRRLLRIVVRDSGDGFDYARLMDDLATNTLPHGRGLLLVNTLSARLEFTRNGSEVTAYYALGHQANHTATAAPIAAM